MATELKEKAGYDELQEELTVKAPAGPVSAPAGAVAAAAEDAAEVYAPDEVEGQGQAIAKAWEAKLKEQLAENKRRARMMAEQPAPEIGGPITAPGSYQWWEVLVAGPFQPIGPLGPFAPHKIIRHGEACFMLCAIVRNPFPIAPGPNPSAAQIMAGQDYRLVLSTGNLTNWVAGPSFGPLGGTFGGGFLNIHVVNLAGFPMPPDGQPHLYEGNVTMDILGPVPGLPPFAGYATWVFDPDLQLPFLFVPGAGPQLQHDISPRWVIYR